ncbi:MAG: (2Fe-2S)-binding protein [Polyangiaceae bacterium]|nr:(2Fe-2S)-binding protein [Polyangiaceae bacterium]
MPTLRFAGLRPELDRIVEAPAGGQLVDICDALQAPVPFSCRAASCGTCVVRVLEGAEHLVRPNDDEAVLLALMGQSESCRLACQAEVRAGPGRVHLQALGSEGGRAREGRGA